MCKNLKPKMFFFISNNEINSIYYVYDGIILISHVNKPMLSECIVFKN